MKKIWVFIEDKIREEHIRTQLETDRRVASITESLVRDFGLPRRNFSLRPLKYNLERARDNQILPGNKTLKELGIRNREILRLVCPEAPQIRQLTQRMLDEIESEIRDQTTGKLKEQVTQEVWQRIKLKLDHLEKTQPGDPRIARYRSWLDTVDFLGGPNVLLEWTEKIFSLFEAKSIAGGLLKLGVTALLSMIVLKGVMPVLGLSPEEPSPPAVVFQTATSTVIDTPTSIEPPTETSTPPVPPTETLSPTTPPTEIPTYIPPTHTEPPSPVPATHTPNPDPDGDGLTTQDEYGWGTDPNVADTDQDNLSDGNEVQSYGTNPLNPDSDGDDLSDDSEVFTYGTLPTEPDTDGDGLSDGGEVFTTGTNPLSWDTDEDDLADGDEINTFHTNPINPDTDDDGLSDGEELRSFGTDPLNPDTDEDGLLDGDGEFTWVPQVWGSPANPLNFDTDGDQYGDGAEMEYGTNPLDSQDFPPPNVEAALWADPVTISGFCPITVDFYGYISWDAPIGGQVIYTFLQNELRSTRFNETVSFKARGSKDVNTNLTIYGEAGETITGEVWIQILDPIEVASEPAYYEVFCERPAPPEQLSPPNGSVFDYYPRTTTLTWSALDGVASYSVEVDCFHCCVRNQWCTDVGQTWSVTREIYEPNYTFNFVGAQPGRWRVWAIFPDGSEGPKSDWWEFSYTQ